MKTPATIRCRDIKVRKHLPSHLVVERVQPSKKTYNRRDKKWRINPAWKTAQYPVTFLIAKPRSDQILG